MMRRRDRSTILCALFAACAPAVFPAGARAGTSFSAPVAITSGGEKFRMSRSADGQLATDSRGMLHATYWSGGDVTGPSSPSHVYHRAYSPETGWSAPEAIDDSEVGGIHIGGRHPSLAVGPDDQVWVAWHDHRHGTAAGSYIDNIEIYADRKPYGGAFSATDLRLTTSSAAHSGDNGFTPKIVVDALGRVTVAWHDFNADADVSDIYLKTSAPGGAFNLAESMASMRATNLTARGGAPAYVTTALALDASGARRLAWAGGIGADAELHYGAAPAGSTALTDAVLPGLTDYYDPPHIEVSPAGDLWIAYGDDAPLAEEVTLLRMRAGQSAFDAPIVIASSPARQFAPDLAFDSLGRAHLVWIDQASGARVMYGVYDPAYGTLLENFALTPTAGAWQSPCVHVDARDRVYVIWEQNVNPTMAGEIWFATTARPNAVDPSLWSAEE